jgi:acyl carrier protein
MMTAATATLTLKRLQKIVAKKFSLPEESISPDATLEGLGLDSLDAIEMLFEVEDEFHIRIPQDRSEDQTKLSTVQDVLNIIDRLMAQQRPQQSA